MEHVLKEWAYRVDQPEAYEVYKAAHEATRDKKYIVRYIHNYQVTICGVCGEIVMEDRRDFMWPSDSLIPLRHMLKHHYRGEG